MRHMLGRFELFGCGCRKAATWVPRSIRLGGCFRVSMVVLDPCGGDPLCVGRWWVRRSWNIPVQTGACFQFAMAGFAALGIGLPVCDPVWFGLSGTKRMSRRCLAYLQEVLPLWPAPEILSSESGFYRAGDFIRVSWLGISPHIRGVVQEWVKLFPDDGIPPRTRGLLETGKIGGRVLGIPPRIRGSYQELGGLSPGRRYTPAYTGFPFFSAPLDVAFRGIPPRIRGSLKAGFSGDHL